MTDAVYPKPPKSKDYKLHRKWRVDYENMLYDNGQASWSKGYRTRLGARIAAFWTYNVASWQSGKVTIVDTLVEDLQSRWGTSTRTFIHNNSYQDSEGRA